DGAALAETFAPELAQLFAGVLQKRQNRALLFFGESELGAETTQLLRTEALRLVARRRRAGRMRRMHKFASAQRSGDDTTAEDARAEERNLRGPIHDGTTSMIAPTGSR